MFWVAIRGSLAVSGRVRDIRGVAHGALLVPSWKGLGMHGVDSSG